MAFDKEERELKKKVKRSKELSETTLDVNTQVEMVQCEKIGNQFIEECDIKTYESGKSTSLESPHTGEEVEMKKIQTIDTTNEEDLKLGIIGDPSVPITAFLKGIGWQNSKQGNRKFTRRMFLLQTGIIAFLLGIIIFEIEPGVAIFESDVFQIATSSVASGGIMMFVVQWWHRKYDNFYDMRFLCLDHAMDGSMHIGISLDDPDYAQHLTDWYGDKSKVLADALESLEQNYIETLKDKDELIYELNAQIEKEREKTGKKIADKLASAKMEYKYMDSGSKTKVWLYVIGTAIACVSSTALIMMYMMGGI